MQVSGVDKEGGFIDLSKKSLNDEDKEEKKKWYDKAKVVHLIMKLTADTLKCDLIDIYEAFGWDLYDNYDHAYDALKLCVSDSERVFSKLEITDEQKEALLKNIVKKMAAAPVKLRSCFNLTCTTYEGIEAIRESMLVSKQTMAESKEYEKFKLVYQLIAPPQYKCEVVTLDKNGGTECVIKAVQIIEKEIK
jgi:translation initiation factor 2 subunit 1